MDCYGSLRLPIVIENEQYLSNQNHQIYYPNLDYESLSNRKQQANNLCFKDEHYLVAQVREQAGTSSVPKDQLDSYIKLNTEYFMAKAHTESKIISTRALIEEEKLLEYREQKAQRLREQEEMRQFKRQFQEKALNAISKGNLEEAMKIYSILNNNNVTTKGAYANDSGERVKSEKKVEVIELDEKDYEDDKMSQTSSNLSDKLDKKLIKKEFNSKKYRHMICLNSNVDNSYKFKLLYKGACEENYEKTCPPAPHFHFIVDLNNYKSHLSLYYKTKPKSQYYRSFRIDNMDMFEKIIKRFNMKRVVSSD